MSHSNIPERRVLVETERGGTVELLAEANRVVIRIEHGDRVSCFGLTPGAASNVGRRLQGYASKALDIRDEESNRR